MTPAEFVDGFFGAALVMAYVWVQRRLPRSMDESLNPTTLDLKPVRRVFHFPVADKLFTETQESQLPIDLIAALWYAGEIRPESLPHLASELLARGLDTPALRQLAGELPTSRRDISPLADRGFQELGTQSPMTTRHSVLVLSRHLARQAVDKLLPPHKAALSISRLCNWEAEEPQREIVELNFAYEMTLDADPIADLSAIDDEVRQACTRFLQKSQI